MTKTHINNSSQDGIKHELHFKLLKAQQTLKANNISAIVIVSGMEGAGKGEVVNQLSEWLDVRDIQTVAFWEETDEQRLRPPFWRFWRALPARGKVSIMFGSWYSAPILNRLFNNLDHHAFKEKMVGINEFEHMLANDGTIIVKLWFHLSKEEVKQRARDDIPIFELKIQKFPLLEKFLKSYDDFEAIAEHALTATSTAQAPWHVIDASDRQYRDLAAGQILVKSFQDAIKKAASTLPAPEEKPATSQENYLATTTLDESLDSETYRQLLEQYQAQLSSLAWQAHYQKKSVVIVFEGWDAAGKGGVIRRISRAIDARLYKAISVGAPTDEEKSHHYLWRFWRHVPLAGYMTFYDRSWYGRVLVERVEEYASKDEWKRAYAEIRHFEKQLTDSGIILFKFWLHISREEQLRRFRERETTPWKMHKISEEDWRNREKWDQYLEAVNEMFTETGTDNARWNIIPAENKKLARIEVLKSVCKGIQSAMND